MSTIELFVKNIDGTLNAFNQYLADFSDADMLVRPVPAANHAAWQMGHMLTFETMLCDMYAPAAAPKLPSDAKTTYGKEGATSDDASRFFKKAEFLDLLAQANRGIVSWVKTLTEADLSRPGPEKFAGWVDTVGDLLMAIMVHRSVHLGQMQVIRRRLGKKVLS
jgi:uncharacterized damage-inducible protein DinB